MASRQISLSNVLTADTLHLPWQIKLKCMTGHGGKYVTGNIRNGKFRAQFLLLILISATKTHAGYGMFRAELLVFLEQLQRAVRGWGEQGRI